MRRGIALFMLVALALAGPVAAAEPTADEIVARHVKARGGLKKIKSVNSLRQTGRITAGANRTAVAVREVKRPAWTRFEFTVQGVTGVYVSDGTRGWKVSPFEGEMAAAALPDDVVAEAAEQADIDGPLVDWKAKGHQVELAGRETVGGREAYKLKLTLKSGAVRHAYIDVKSGNLLRSDSTRTVRGHAVQVQTTFGDFKKSGGVVFPRLIEITAVGRPQKLRILLDKVEVNPPLSEARFTMPAAAK